MALGSTGSSAAVSGPPGGCGVWFVGCLGHPSGAPSGGPRSPRQFGALGRKCYHLFSTFLTLQRLAAASFEVALRVKAGPEPTGSLPAVEIALVLGPVPLPPAIAPSSSSAGKAGGQCRRGSQDLHEGLERSRVLYPHLASLASSLGRFSRRTGRALLFSAPVCESPLRLLFLKRPAASVRLLTPRSL